MRILLADVQAGIDRLVRVLVGRHDLLIARSMSDASQLVHHWEDIDLIICGLQFDDSRMLDLLKEIKARGVSKHIPFVCFRQPWTELSEGMEHSADVAAGLMGACTYINASDATGMTDQELLQLIEKQLEIDRPKRQGRQAARGAESSVTGYRIFFLDDNPEHIKVLMEAGGLGGHEIIVRNTLQESMDWLNKKNHMDVIVTSVHLREESIFQFVKAVKEDPRHNWVQVILLAPAQIDLAKFMERSLKQVAGGVGADKYIVMDKFDAVRLLKEIQASLPEMPPQKQLDPIRDALGEPRPGDQVPEDVTDAQHPKKGKKPRCDV